MQVCKLPFYCNEAVICLDSIGRECYIKLQSRRRSKLKTPGYTGGIIQSQAYGEVDYSEAANIFDLCFSFIDFWAVMSPTTDMMAIPAWPAMC